MHAFTLIAAALSAAAPVAAQLIRAVEYTDTFDSKSHQDQQTPEPMHPSAHAPFSAKYKVHVHSLTTYLLRP